MFSQKGDNRNYLGSAAFVVLFFLFICAFSENADKPLGDIIKYRYAPELQLNVATLADVRQFPFLKSLLPLIDKLNPGQFNEGLHVIANNHFFQQRIISFQKTILIVKPVVFQHFFAFYHFINTDDFPALS